MGNKVSEESYIDLNAALNTWTEDHTINFDADKEAVRQYHLQHVNPHTQYHPTLEDKLDFLFVNGYYDKKVWDQFSMKQLHQIYEYAASFRHRFSTTLGAMKFYTSYGLKSFDGKTYLERFEDRVVACALELSGGDFNRALNIVQEIITGRLQPATPTFANAGKVQRGERVSCFLLDVQDNMESIGRVINSSLQLSKRGGGVGINISNIREAGAPIKRIENQSSGVLPVCKLLDDSFTYANQLGARQGAGAVYISVHHPDVMRVLDSKRENADEKIRLKTLSVGLVITDKAYQVSKEDGDLYQFSPYDVERVYGVPFSKVDISAEYDKMVENPKIRKTKIKGRELFTTIAELQFQSGYPYILNIDTTNRANPIHGTIDMSNLCSEIVQVSTPSKLKADLSYEEVGRDISCNLASMNVSYAMKGKNLAHTVETAIRLLTEVSDLTELESVPSIQNGNDKSHSVGLGQFGLHQFFLEEGLKYGDENSLNFTNIYFMSIAYHAYRASNKIARERKQVFFEFDKSKYADPEYLTAKYRDPAMIEANENTKAIFAKYGMEIPNEEDWLALSHDIAEYGLYNAYLQAVPPTGSISYINGGTSSIHPAVAAIEARKEGSIGRIYYPTPGLSNSNFADFEDAYQIGYKSIIDVYAEAQKHVDQALSCTLFYTDEHTTRDLTKAYIYAYKKGLKSLYYARVRSSTLEGTEVETCVSCTL